MRATTAWIALALVVTVGTRLVGLGTWPLDGDEIYSAWDVEIVLTGEPWSEGLRSHPLGYLGMAAAAAIGGIDAFWLRLFPALCGIGGVLALALMRRDVVPAAAAAATASIAALSWWLIYHAQTARFYGPLFLFAALATLWALPGAGRRPVASTLAWGAASLCHPSAALLGLGLAVPIARAPGGPRRLATIGVAVLVLGAAVALSPWSAIVDSVRRAVLRSTAADYDVTSYVLGLGYSLGPAVGLAVLVGLWRLRARADDVAWTIAACGLLPSAALLAGAAAGISMHQRYTMAAVPALLLIAGWGLADWLARRRVAGVGLAALLVAVPMPELLSFYRDGNRHDMRAAAAWLADRAEPVDVIIADEHKLLELYLHEHAEFAGKVTHEAPLDEDKMDVIPRGRRAAWLVLKANRIGRAYGREFDAWVAEHFEEVARIGYERLPLTRHVNTLVVSRRRARADRRASPAPRPGVAAPADGGGGV